jgi:hypothetical protein
MSPYPRGFKRIQRNLDLSAPKQPYPPQIKPIHPKTILPAARQACFLVDNLVLRWITLLSPGQPCIPADNPIFPWITLFSPG